MTELIIKDAAIKAITDAIWHLPNDVYPKINTYETVYNVVKDAIKGLPTVEPGLNPYIDKLTEECETLKGECRVLEAQKNDLKAECIERDAKSKELLMKIDDLQQEAKTLTSDLRRLSLEQHYNHGMIAGLKFSIKCNGVSGNEVLEAQEGYVKCD